MLETEERPAAVTERRGTPATTLIVAGCAIAAALWGLRDWEWSLVDDPYFRLNLLLEQDENGWFGGIWERMAQSYQADVEGGQFRPFLYLYAGVFYLADASLAHVLRLLMFFAAALAPAIWLSRVRGAGVAIAVWAAMIFLSIPGFYEGLGFLSVMELPGMLFAGLGFLDRDDRRRSAWLLLAASCKSPFVVLPLLYAGALVLRRRWVLAGVTGGLALALLAASVIWARRGTYTGGYALNRTNIVATIDGVAHQAWLPLVVVLAGLLLIEPRAIRLSERAVVFGLGGLGYLTLMLPWGTRNGYNLAPIVYLGACAAVALAATAVARQRAAVVRWRVVAALILAVVPAVHAGRVAVSGILARDTTIRQTVAWLEEQPRSTRVATNGIESSSRLSNLAYLRGDTSWTPDRMIYAPPGTALSCRVDYLIELNDQGPAGVPDVAGVVRSFPLGRIYQIAPCANGAS